MPVKNMHCECYAFCKQIILINLHNSYHSLFEYKANGTIIFINVVNSSKAMQDVLQY